MPTNSEKVIFYCDPQMQELLEVFADLQDCSVSDVLRRLIIAEQLRCAKELESGTLLENPGNFASAQQIAQIKNIIIGFKR